MYKFCACERRVLVVRYSKFAVDVSRRPKIKGLNPGQCRFIFGDRERVIYGIRSGRILAFGLLWLSLHFEFKIKWTDAYKRVWMGFID